MPIRIWISKNEAQGDYGFEKKERLTALARSIKRSESRIIRLQSLGEVYKGPRERFLIHEEILNHSTVLRGLKKLYWEDV